MISKRGVRASQSTLAFHKDKKAETPGVERTRARRKIQKLPRRELSHCVFRLTKSDLVRSLMGRNSVVFSVGRRLRAGLCLGGVSPPIWREVFDH